MCTIQLIYKVCESLASAELRHGKLFLFRCSTTRRNVQGYLEDAPPADGSTRYAAIECLACGLPHPMINVATLKLRSEEQED